MVAVEAVQAGDLALYRGADTLRVGRVSLDELEQFFLEDGRTRKMYPLDAGTVFISRREAQGFLNAFYSIVDPNDIEPRPTLAQLLEGSRQLALQARQYGAFHEAAFDLLPVEQPNDSATMCRRLMFLLLFWQPLL